MTTGTTIPNPIVSSSDSSRDPLGLLIEIAKDNEISEKNKQALYQYANTRFKNRRRMAYIALTAIVASLVFLFVGALIDAGTTCEKGKECIRILDTIKENQTLFSWIEGFLTSIVALYFGVSSWRPAS
jgi:hypothetical protein